MPRVTRKAKAKAVEPPKDASKFRKTPQMLLRDICAMVKHATPVIEISGSEPHGTNPGNEVSQLVAPFRVKIIAGDLLLEIRFQAEYLSPGHCKKIANDLMLKNIFKDDYELDCEDTKKFTHIKCAKNPRIKSKWPKWEHVNVNQRENKVWHFRFNQTCRALNLKANWDIDYDVKGEGKNNSLTLSVTLQQLNDDASEPRIIFELEHEKEWPKSNYKASNLGYQEMIVKQELSKALVEELISVGLISGPDDYEEALQKKFERNRLQNQHETPEQTKARLQLRAEDRQKKLEAKWGAKAKSRPAGWKPQAVRAKLAGKPYDAPKVRITAPRGWSPKAPVQFVPVQPQYAQPQFVQPQYMQSQYMQPVMMVPQQAQQMQAPQMQAPRFQQTYEKPKAVAAPVEKRLKLKLDGSNPTTALEQVKSRHDARMVAMQAQQIEVMKGLQSQLQEEMDQMYKQFGKPAANEPAPVPVEPSYQPGYNVSNTNAYNHQGNYNQY